MTKRKILNAFMVLIVIAIAVCGFMAVKSLKGNPIKAETNSVINENSQAESLSVVS